MAAHLKLVHSVDVPALTIERRRNRVIYGLTATSILVCLGLLVHIERAPHQPLQAGDVVSFERPAQVVRLVASKQAETGLTCAYRNLDVETIDFITGAVRSGNARVYASGDRAGQVLFTQTCR